MFEKINVATGWRMIFESENHNANIKVPYVTGPERFDAAMKELNNKVMNDAHSAMDEFNNDMEEYPDSFTGLMVSYDTIMNNARWFTLQLTITTTAASSNTRYKIYNIDRNIGKIVELEDLFPRNYDYVTVISENIKMQMREQMKTDDGITYFIRSSEEPDGFDKIKRNQNFYFNDKGNLVIVFDQGEVAPSYVGTPKFVIPKAEKKF